MGNFEKIDFLDDKNDIAIGKISGYEKHFNSYSYAVVAIGNPDLRLRLISKLEETGYAIPVLVHPTTYISPDAQITDGSIIEPMAVAHTGCVISKACIISAGAVINHGAVCSEGCHIDCNATVMGNVVVLPKTHLLCGEVFKK